MKAKLYSISTHHRHHFKTKLNGNQTERATCIHLMYGRLFLINLKLALLPSLMIGVNLSFICSMIQPPVPSNRGSQQHNIKNFISSAHQAHQHTDNIINNQNGFFDKHYRNKIFGTGTARVAHAT